MTRFQVDLAELEGVVADLAASERVIESKLTELDALVAALHVTWTGSAAAAQRQAHEAWAAGAREMHQALGRIRAAGQRAHDNYSAAARANTEMWDQV